MKRTIVVVVCSLAFSLGSSAQRLPDNVVPESYDLKFEPNLASATFSGDETIHVRLQKPSSSIVLNSAEIKFEEVTITSGGSRQTAAVSSDEKNEMATFTVPNPIRFPQIAVSFAEVNSGATPGTCTDRLMVGYN